MDASSTSENRLSIEMRDDSSAFCQISEQSFPTLPTQFSSPSLAAFYQKSDKYFCGIESVWDSIDNPEVEYGEP